MNLSIVGKGGVGKTTVSAALALLLSRRGDDVFAVDGDANNCLGYVLGFPDDDLASLKPLSDMQEKLEERAKPGGGGMYLLKPPVADLIDQFTLSRDGMRLLVMGSVGAGTGCACGVNAALREVLRELIKRPEAIVVDMEAGIEHLGRSTADALDTMLMVAEPYSSSIRTCQRIARMAEELGVSNVIAVANKVENDDDIDAVVRGGLDGTPVVATVPYIEGLREPITDSSTATEQLLAELEPVVEDLAE